MNDKLKPGTGKQNLPKQAKQGQAPADRTIFRKGSTTRVNARQPLARPTSKVPEDATRIPPQRKVDATNISPRRAVSNDATRIKSPARSRPVPNAGQHKAEKTRLRNAQQTGSKTRLADTAHHQVLKGRFTLDKVIGVGGMGVVYKATDRLKVEAKDREPFVAIKVLSEEFKSHPESFIALQRESRKTQRMAHPNVVKVYDFDRDGDIVFMTMEYMEGRPLDQLIKQYSATGLPGDDVWDIMGGLCSALIHAHSEKIVHSDFKPGNIFITNSGTAKIFDFGIARAVANIDHMDGSNQDRTVFDAGSLGALTPAYASLEMLQGKKPDVRDDIYALGCIAYEMLTGEHPYNRIPADEAYKSRLKPARIPGIKKRQWKAIEKSLSFKREDRIDSVEEFYTLIQPKIGSSSILIATSLIIISIAIATYFIVKYTASPQQQNKLQADVIEFNIRYNLFKEKIDKLIGAPTFSVEWEREIWDEVSGITLLLGNRTDEWLLAVRRKIYQMYLDKINKMLRNIKYARALEILGNAYRYTTDTRFLDSGKEKLVGLIRQETERQKILDAKSRRVTKAKHIKRKKDRKRTIFFELALKNVNQQLQCKSKLTMRDFGIAINKLRSLNPSRYAKMENNIIVTLVECITKIGKTQAERAIEAKKYALRIFKNNSFIAGINITARDVCNKSIAGLGGRGEQAVCRDKLANIGVGPALVVIPGNKSSLSPFAIGKYEVTVKEINQYCRVAQSCQPSKLANSNLPVSNISINVASGYVKWLSKMTKQKYRLPTRAEWTYAANATNRIHDPNRNCELNTRGIEKGGQLVRATAGRRNSWGLVNYLGNAREWVYDKSRNLIVVGGSFEDSMDRCTVSSYTMHSGKADRQTGFRVLREVKK